MSTSAERMRRLRERRAAALIPIEGAPLQAADELLRPAVEETLAALDLAPEDVGTAQLAARYADLIDQARDPAGALRWVGPAPAGRAAGAAGDPRKQGGAYVTGA